MPPKKNSVASKANTNTSVRDWEFYAYIIPYFYIYILGNDRCLRWLLQ